MAQISEQLRLHYADHYEAGSSEWRELGAADKAAHIVDLCSSRPHDSILEIGAGDGSILKRLREVGFGKAWNGLEVSPTGVSTVRGVGFPCELFDGYNIPHQDAAFDLAVLSHVVEHVEHPRLLLYEAARVARSVFIEVPLEDNIRLKHDFVLDRVGHINFYSAKTIRLLAQSCGLRVLSQVVSNQSLAVYRYQKGSRGVVNHVIKRVLLAANARFATSLFTYHCALLCIKH